MISNITPEECKTIIRVWQDFSFLATLFFDTELNCCSLLTFQVKLKPNSIMRNSLSSFFITIKSPPSPWRNNKINTASNIPNFHLPTLRWNAYTYWCCSLLRWTNRKHLLFQGTKQFHPWHRNGTEDHKLQNNNMCIYICISFISIFIYLYACNIYMHAQKHRPNFSNGHLAIN